MIRRYKVSSHNSTVLGYPGRNFDWSLFCWDGSEWNKAKFKGDEEIQAPIPWWDSSRGAGGCEYIHVPYNFTERGTIYRVRPNDSMYAGAVYRGRLVRQQRAVLVDGAWYWELDLEIVNKAEGSC